MATAMSKKTSLRVWADAFFPPMKDIIKFMFGMSSNSRFYEKILQNFFICLFCIFGSLPVIVLNCKIYKTNKFKSNTI